MHITVSEQKGKVNLEIAIDEDKESLEFTVMNDFIIIKSVEKACSNFTINK